MLKQQFIEKSKKKLLEKWKRIEKTMTNHMSGRKIWDADTNGLDDEANYLFVDETLENFLDSALSECWDMAKQKKPEENLFHESFKDLEEGEGGRFYREGNSIYFIKDRDVNVGSFTPKQEDKV